MPLPIGLYPLCPTDRIGGQTNFVETVTRQVVESEIPTDQKRSIGCIAKCRARSSGHSLRGSKFLEPLPVISKDTVFRAHPKEACVVLVYLPDREIGEPFRASQIPEAVLLREQHTTREYRKDKGAYICGTTHHWG